MAENALIEEAAGTAAATYALAQIMLWQLMQQGLLAKSDALEMLKRKVDLSNRRGGHHEIAAAKLACLMHSIEAYRAPERQRAA